MKIMRIRPLALAAAAFCVATGVAAQSSSTPPKKEESVADLARRARELRERKATSRPVREFTNETIPPERFPFSAPGAGEQDASPLATTSAPASESAIPTAEAEKERSKTEGELAAEKQNLENLKKQLDLLQRETKLNKDSFYAKPDYANDRAGATALAVQEAAIEAKRAEIQASEAKVAELDTKVRGQNERLGPRPEEPRTPEQTRDQWAARLRPLQDELVRVNNELARINQDRTALGNSGSNPAGSFTGDRIAQLERRRAELQRQIDEIESDARRAGTLPIRP